MVQQPEDVSAGNVDYGIPRLAALFKHEGGKRVEARRIGKMIRKAVTQ